MKIGRFVGEVRRAPVAAKPAVPRGRRSAGAAGSVPGSNMNQNLPWLVQGGPEFCKLSSLPAVARSAQLAESGAKRENGGGRERLEITSSRGPADPTLNLKFETSLITPSLCHSGS